MKKNFAERAYQTTTVDINFSEGQIIKMLESLGIVNIQITRVASDYRLEFFAQLRKDEMARKVRIDIPFMKELEDKNVDIEHKKNVLFRVLYWHLKDRFVAIQNGLREFEEEFLSDLVVMYNNKEVRLGSILVPQYKKQLKDNKLAVVTKLIN